MFVESDHVFLDYVNTALLQWFSKIQSKVETSVFDAEFVAMKQGIDQIQAEDDGYSYMQSLTYLW